MNTISILRVNGMSQSDFPVTVKGQTKIGRQVNTDRVKHNTCTDFTGRYEVVQRCCHRQK